MKPSCLYTLQRTTDDDECIVIMRLVRVRLSLGAMAFAAGVLDPTPGGFDRVGAGPAGEPADPA